MGLIKLLPWIIIIIVALVYYSRQKQRREKEQMEEELREMRRRLQERERNRDVASAGEMAQCPHCGTFFPKNEGVVKNGKLYCSKKCARLD